MATLVEEKVAWIHEIASTLTAEDPVELKTALRRLAAEANETAELVAYDLRRQRRPVEKAQLQNRNSSTGGRV